MNTHHVPALMDTVNGPQTQSNITCAELYTVQKDGKTTCVTMLYQGSV